jgi:hypothetical protein
MNIIDRGDVLARINELLLNYGNLRITSGAEARVRVRQRIAALKALRHPKPQFPSVVRQTNRRLYFESRGPSSRSSRTFFASFAVKSFAFSARYVTGVISDALH